VISRATVNGVHWPVLLTIVPLTMASVPMSMHAVRVVGGGGSGGAVVVVVGGTVVVVVGGTVVVVVGGTVVVVVVLVVGAVVVLGTAWLNAFVAPPQPLMTPTAAHTTTTAEMRPTPARFTCFISPA
jgi:hypothetical protein